jgi:predicted nuclease of predicted toxin-antitoxin system
LKLLVDENLPPRIAVDLADLFPDSGHVGSVGLGSTSDSVIWEYIKTHGFAFLTKDKDFANLSIARGAPPKVIVRNNAVRFADFEEDARRSLLVLR